MLGEACALAAALTWSISVILFACAEAELRSATPLASRDPRPGASRPNGDLAIKRSEAASPVAMALFKNVVALVLLVLTLLALGEPLLATGRSRDDWVRLCVSGILGVAVCDTLVFMALRRLGASLLAVVDCAYAPTTVLLSVVVLGEPLGGGFGLGAALVVGGVLAVAAEPAPSAPDQEHDPQGRAVGVVLGLIGIVAMAIGVVLAKPALAQGHLVEVTAVRMAAGVAAQLLWVALRPGRAETLRVFVHRDVWPTLLPASVLGTYVAMLFWLGGFKWAPVSVASVLNQLASAFTVLLAWLVLREPLTPRRALGTAAAVGGAALVLAGRAAG
ncbi:MAG: DMT family transporter [Planctomycetota bacterium]